MDIGFGLYFNLVHVLVMKTPLIEFRNVTKRFGDLTILDCIDFQVERGKITTIIGKSGMGKTVILKHLIGLMEPDSGEILFEGKPINKLGRKERSFMKSKCGYMFQNVALFDSMTAFDNVALPLREKTNLSEFDIYLKVMGRFEKLEIDHIALKYPAQISGGMQKRVGLARVLVMEPEIILFDEPTTGLDPVRKNAVHSMIAQMQREFDFTAIIVSHEIPDVFYFSHKIAMLDTGKILVAGTPNEVQTCTNEVVQQFIQGSSSLRDELTGLNHKGALEHQFEHEYNREISHGPFVGLVIFRIKNIHKINNYLGFSVGQELFGRLAERVSTAVGRANYNGKYSDDIVVAMMPGADNERAHDVIDTVSRDIKAHPLLPMAGHRPLFYAIEAAAVMAHKGDDFDKLVANACDKLENIGNFETC